MKRGKGAAKAPTQRRDIYWYQHIAGGNSHIEDYRGYVDLLVKYGSRDDDWRNAVIWDRLDGLEPAGQLTIGPEADI